jgi:hypothetical protein
MIIRLLENISPYGWDKLPVHLSWVWAEGRRENDNSVILYSLSPTTLKNSPIK